MPVQHGAGQPTPATSVAASHHLTGPAADADPSISQPPDTAAAWAALADLYRTEGGWPGVDDLSTSVYTHHVARCDGTLRALSLLHQHREDEAYSLLTDCFLELQDGWAGSALLSGAEPSAAEEACWFDARMDALAALGQWQVGCRKTISIPPIMIYT